MGKTKYPTKLTKKQYDLFIEYISEYIGTESWEFGIDECIGKGVVMDDIEAFDEAFFAGKTNIYPVKYLQREVLVEEQVFKTRTLLRKWWDSLIDKT